jgi:hypothetical protein
MIIERNLNAARDPECVVNGLRPAALVLLCEMRIYGFRSFCLGSAVDAGHGIDLTQGFGGVDP